MKIRSYLGIKATAVLVAAGGLGLGLVGTGVRATFTDSATATESVSVGTMGINISSTTTGAVVSNNNHTVSFTCPTIQSSAPGSCTFNFTVKNVGSMNVQVTVASSDAFVAPWSDAFVNPGVQTITPGNSYSYTGGIAWATLSNSDLGSSHSVTYTVSATA